MEGAAGDAGLGGEIRGGNPGGGGADHDVPVASERVGEGGERGRLAGAGVADHADDPVRARGDRSQHRRLLAAEHRPAVVGDPLDRRRRDNRGANPAAARGKPQRRPLVAQQLGR